MRIVSKINVQYVKYKHASSKHKQTHVLTIYFIKLFLAFFTTQQ